MTKHTPGPWKRQDTADYAEIVTTDERFVVAMVARETDADLIAAAPELLEALTDLVIYHDVPASAQDPVVLPLLRAAFSAIAKTEGRAA